MNKIIAVVFALIHSLSLAQSGTVSGNVRGENNEPLPFISIAVEGTQLGTTTNETGQFTLNNVPVGKQKIVATSVGYDVQVKKVNVASGQTINIDFVLLKSVNQLSVVEIEGSGNKYRIDSTSQSLRLRTPILEVPQNIQVVTKEVLNDQQAFDMLEGVQRNVSGAQKVEHWDNYARINMRGSQVTAFRNGMNVQMPWGPLSEDMSMVERIEFVKGPAGFMLANGEPSGFYNVVTKKPTGINKGEVTFSLGSFEYYRSTIDLDGKLSKNGKLLYRINFMGQLKGSHRDYEYNNRYSIVPVIKYLIDDKSAITFEYTHQFSQMNVIGSNYAFSKRGYADLPVNFTTAEANLEPTRIQDRSILGIFEHSFNSNWKFTAQAAFFHYDQVGQSIWPWGISMYNDSLMQRGISIWDALGLSKTGQMFVNGKAKTGGIVHNILGGVDMGHKDYYADWNQGAALGDSTFNIYEPVYGTIPVSEIPVWDRSRDVRERGVRYNSSYNAIYLQDELGFFDNKVRLTLAGRYTTNKYINPYSGTSNDGKFTPRAGVSISITKNTTAYAVYDESFIASPGLDWQGNNFDPVSATNMEVGVKKDWFNGRWNTAISAYQITRNNMLTADLEHPDPVTGQFIYSRQTGQQQVKGVEFDARGQLVKGVSVVINYAYTDAKITKDSDPEVIGNKVAGATEQIQNTWLTYRIGSGKLDGMRFSLGYQYQAGRSSWFIFDNTENSLPDYFRLDGGIGYQKEKFNVSLNVNNILNKYLYSGAPYYGMFYWQTEPRINTRVTVGYKF
jgi:iron complex outermembrane recepter protein